MKAFIISAVTLLFVIGGVILNSAIVTKSVEAITERLENTPEELSFGDEYRDIFDDYMRRQRYIGITVSHDDLTNIESEFCEIIGAIEAADEEGLIIAKSRLVGALRHLGRLSGINADSIF